MKSAYHGKFFTTATYEFFSTVGGICDLQRRNKRLDNKKEWMWRDIFAPDEGFEFEREFYSAFPIFASAQSQSGNPNPQDSRRKIIFG